MTSDRRLKQAELVFDVDSLTVEQAGVPCPVEWCEAHVIRRGPCGDSKGDFYGGVHRGRLNAVNRQAAVARRKVKQFEEMGVAEPEISAGMAQLIEDSRNMGMIHLETDRQRRQKRARRLAKMPG